jgi:outer membrane protein
MKSLRLFAFTAAVALLSGTASFADDAKIGVGTGDLLVRVRALGVFPDVSGHDTLLGGKIGIGDSYVPELDAAYFLTDYLAGEIIAGTTFHNVKDKYNLSGTPGGNIGLGHVWLLPPTLTAQLHPLGRSAIDPYVGAGVNYTIFYGSGGAQTIFGQSTKVDYKNSFGAALQAGVNYQVDGPWFFNADVKKIFLSTSADVTSGAVATHARVAIDPWLVGVGVGYRF